MQTELRVGEKATLEQAEKQLLKNFYVVLNAIFQPNINISKVPVFFQ